MTTELNDCPPISLDVYYTMFLDFFPLILLTLRNKCQSVVGFSAFRKMWFALACEHHSCNKTWILCRHFCILTVLLVERQHRLIWISNRVLCNQAFKYVFGMCLCSPNDVTLNIKYGIRAANENEVKVYCTWVSLKKKNSLKWKLLFIPSDHRS